MGKVNGIEGWGTIMGFPFYRIELTEIVDVEHFGGPMHGRVEAFQTPLVSLREVLIPDEPATLIEASAHAVTFKRGIYMLRRRKERYSTDSTPIYVYVGTSRNERLDVETVFDVVPNCRCTIQELREAEQERMGEMKKQATFVEVVLPEERDDDGDVTREETVLYESEKSERLTSVERRRDNILHRPKILDALKREGIEDVSSVIVRTFLVPFVVAA